MPDDVDLAAALREVIRERMDARDLTVAQLARLAGLQEMTVGRWIRGKAAISVGALPALAEAMGTSAGYLVTLAEGRAASGTVDPPD